MKNAKILIVESECIIAKDIRNRLIKFGWTLPTIAYSGKEAIKKAAEVRPHLVIIDIKLAGDINSVNTIKKICTRFIIPVIYLTTRRADNSLLEQAKVSKPFFPLIKPFQAEDFYTTIEVALSTCFLRKSEHQ